jgi:hypothetical protein
MPEPIRWYHRLVHQDPEQIRDNLERIREHGLVARVPNLWQLGLGVLRMTHRVMFRSETIGTCREHAVRNTWRARVLENRAIRLPFLLAEKAVAPLDFSGLASSPDRVVSHLLGAHHDGLQFAYDLSLLTCYPGKLEEVRDKARAVITDDTERARWLRDLTVYERYHEKLLEAVEDAIAHGVHLPEPDASDPDISFTAYLDWCASQPATPAETLAAMRMGRYTISGGLMEAMA